MGGHFLEISLFHSLSERKMNEKGGSKFELRKLENLAMLIFPIVRVLLLSVQSFDWMGH